MPDCLSIRNRTPFLDAQTQGKNLARNEGKVGILNVAKQKLGAGVDENCLHQQKTLNV
jgi:hypothetical protein